MQTDENNIQNLLNYVETMDNQRYKNTVKGVITNDKNKPVVEALLQAKDTQGEPLLDNHNMAMFLYNAKHTIENSPDKIHETLANPEIIKQISSGKNRAGMLWFATSSKDTFPNKYYSGR